MLTVASANPSRMPTVRIDTPKVFTIKSGNTLWMDSEDTSINMLTIPRVHIALGTGPLAPLVSIEFLFTDYTIMIERCSGRRIESASIYRFTEELMAKFTLRLSRIAGPLMAAILLSLFLPNY